MRNNEKLDTKKSIFVIEKIDQEKGTCSVRYINALGPIETGKIKKEDVDPSVENPNHDIIYVYNLPLDEDGQYFPADALIQHFAAQYPHLEFEVMQMRMKARKRADYQSIINERFDVSLQWARPIHLTNFTIFPDQNEIEVETL